MPRKTAISHSVHNNFRTSPAPPSGIASKLRTGFTPDLAEISQAAIFCSYPTPRAAYQRSYIPAWRPSLLASGHQYLHPSLHPRLTGTHCPRTASHPCHPAPATHYPRSSFTPTAHAPAPHPLSPPSTCCSQHPPLIYTHCPRTSPVPHPCHSAPGRPPRRCEPPLAAHCGMQAGRPVRRSSAVALTASSHGITPPRARGDRRPRPVAGSPLSWHHRCPLHRTPTASPRPRHAYTSSRHG